MESPNVIRHHATVTRERRERLNGHRGAVIWFTGLPSSGKSTIAHAVEEALHRTLCRTFVLDGDNVRHGLCGDLGFSLSSLLIAATVSGSETSFQPGDFLEIYCRCLVTVCEAHDPKHHYQRARAGDIKDFTGVSAPYEEPHDADLMLDAAALPIEASVERVCALLTERGIIPHRIDIDISLLG